MTEAQIEYVATHEERDRCVRIVEQYAADVVPGIHDKGMREAIALTFKALVSLLRAGPS
jgi:hypothetical protein